jgi:hypothetical protein
MTYTHLTSIMRIVPLCMLAACSHLGLSDKPDSDSDSSVSVTDESIILGTGGLTTKRPIRPSELQVTLVNVIPSENYRVEGSVESRIHTVDPIDIRSSLGFEPGGRGPTPTVTDCVKARESFNSDLEKATSEEDVAQLGRELEARLKTNNCDQDTIKVQRASFDESTTYSLDRRIRVEKGELAIVNITREKSAEISEKTFPEIRFETKAEVPGQWLIYYGFNYIEVDDDKYFSMSNPSTDPQTYTITAQSSRDGYDFSPSLYFMFVRNENHENHWLKALSWNSGDWLGGITAGVGFDFDSPSVFLGYGIGYGYNIVLNAGLAMRKVDRLDGKYEVDQVIMEDLESDQLATSTYEPGFFVGLAFRFGANPFKKGGDSSDTQIATAAPVASSDQGSKE